MEQKIRVLGIAPYEGLKTSLLSIAREFPQIELNVFLGDLESGLEIAKKNFHKNYDAVISRGMTAQLLLQLPIPVVEIDISMYDILSTINLANTANQKTAIVSFADTTDIAKQIREINNLDIDIYTLSSPESAEDVLMQCQKSNYSTIICDMVANQAARKLGINSFLITSGQESIRKAFSEILSTSRNIKNLRSENAMFRKLLNGQISNTIVFDTNRNVMLSTIEEPSNSILDMLREEIDETQSDKDRHITKMRNGEIFNIRCQEIESDGKSYTAFFFTNRKTALTGKKTGIQFYSRMQSEETYLNSSLFIADMLHSIDANIIQLAASTKPILIVGEHGTERKALAHYFHIHSQFSRNQLSSIDCQLLSEKNLQYLLENHSSPLADSNTTILLQNINSLNYADYSKLLSSLLALDVFSTNKLIITAICSSEGKVPKVITDLVDKINATVVFIPPLRDNKTAIPKLVNATLNELNPTLSHRIAGVDESAMILLQNYSWPNNIKQIKRVIADIAMTESEYKISEKTVCSVLQNQQHLGYVSDDYEQVKPINLNRSLQEIETEIVQRVLGLTNGNQAETARKLKISRTTLWRILKNSN